MANVLANFFLLELRSQRYKSSYSSSRGSGGGRPAFLALASLRRAFDFTFVAPKSIKSIISLLHLPFSAAVFCDPYKLDSRQIVVELYR